MGEDDEYGNWPPEFTDKEVSIAKHIAKDEVVREVIDDFKMEHAGHVDPDYPDDPTQESIQTGIAELEQIGKRNNEEMQKLLNQDGMSDWRGEVRAPSADSSMAGLPAFGAFGGQGPQDDGIKG